MNQIIQGDCLATLREMADSSVDSIVTDPPYGLSFMGKSWDYDVPAVAVWAECLRVLKPGGHLLAFAGTRTQHRKPLAGTVDANWREHGTGALNIDGCRVETTENLNGGAYAATRQESTSEWAASGSLHKSTGQEFVQPTGRWPANLIHDGSDEVQAAFPDAPGQMADVSATAPSPKTSNVYGRMAREGEPSARSTNEGAVGFKMKPGARRQDTGSAARFFYCAKASKKDRGAGNTHPTVKPTELMRYLCRLVTPVGGLVLDPFAGSGSTGVAAGAEGFRFIGIERDAAYAEIARQRLGLPPEDDEL